MKQLGSIYILVLASLLLCTAPLFDFADNKQLAYNLIGYGFVELLDKSSKKDSTVRHQLSIGRYSEYKRAPLSNLITASYSASKSIRDYFSLGVSGHFYSTDTEEDWVPGVGGRLWFGWHIVRTEAFKLTFDNGVGPNYFFEAFPKGGTRFNFSTYYGLKASFKVSQSWMTLRLTNLHISNAEIKGRERNPALDAIGIRLSYEW